MADETEFTKGFRAGWLARGKAAVPKVEPPMHPWRKWTGPVGDYAAEPCGDCGRPKAEHPYEDALANAQKWAR